MDAYRYLAKAYNSLMADVDYDAWASYINSLLGRADLRIFEAGCGTGNITGRLYDMGHHVVAADISSEMLDVAMNDARSHGRKIVFLQQDMRRIDAGRQFDAVISACDGPNYLGPNGLSDFFSGAYHILKRNGKLLFDISSAHKLRQMDGEVFYDDGDDAVCIWHNRFNDAGSQLAMDVTLFIRKGELYEKLTEQHVQYAHEISAVSQALTSAGFGRIDIYEAFTKDAPQTFSSRIQFVCHKD